MIPYGVYKVVHLTGLFFLFGAVGATALYYARRPDRDETRKERRFLMVLHGISLFIVLLGGFGLLARIGVQQGSAFPPWVWPKLGVWILIGASIVVFKRMPQLARPLFLLLPLLGAFAAYCAVYKPWV